MRFIDVKVRIPKSNLGDFLENLPVWKGQMIGYDLLTEVVEATNGVKQPKKKDGRGGNRWGSRAPDGSYQPGAGTLTEKLWHKLQQEELRPQDMDKAFPKANHHSVNSALNRLRKFGLVDRGEQRGFWRAK